MVPNKTVPNKTVPKWTTFTNKPQEVKAKFVVRFPNWTSSVCNWAIPDKMRPLDHCFQQSNLVACHESGFGKSVCQLKITGPYWAGFGKAKVFQIFSQKRCTKENRPWMLWILPAKQQHFWLLSAAMQDLHHFLSNACRDQVEFCPNLDICIPLHTPQPNPLSSFPCELCNFAGLFFHWSGSWRC